MNSICKQSHFILIRFCCALLSLPPGLGHGYSTCVTVLRCRESGQVSVSSWWKVSSACFSSGPELRCVAGLLGTPVMCRTRLLVRLVLRTLLLLSSFRLDRLCFFLSKVALSKDCRTLLPRPFTTNFTKSFLWFSLLLRSSSMGMAMWTISSVITSRF